VIKEFIDTTTDNQGTPINRANMMAIQGFIGCTVEYGDNGEIIETNANGEVLTTIKNADGGYTQVFVGEKTITKTTTFNNDGTITEVIS
jgi:hypothetical protein